MDPLPQQPTPPNPYGFITNPPPPPKKTLFSGGSTKSRALLVGILVAALLIVAIIVSSVLSSVSNSGTTELKTVYAEQQELIRLAEIGLKDAVGPDARSFSATTLLSTRTSQQDIQKVISDRGAKISSQEAAAKKNNRVEEILTGAAANNRYDETIIELMEQRITSYNQALDAANKANENEQARRALSNAYSSSKALVATSSYED